MERDDELLIRKKAFLKEIEGVLGEFKIEGVLGEFKRVAAVLDFDEVIEKKEEEIEELEKLKLLSPEEEELLEKLDTLHPMDCSNFICFEKSELAEKYFSKNQQESEGEDDPKKMSFKIKHIDTSLDGARIGIEHNGVLYMKDINDEGDYVSTSGRTLKSAERMTALKNFGLGLLGMFAGGNVASSFRQDYDDREPQQHYPQQQRNKLSYQQQNRPAHESNPQSIQGCIIRETESFRVWFSYHCEYCGWTDSSKFSVNRNRSGTDSGGFVCHNCKKQQSYKILHG